MHLRLQERHIYILLDKVKEKWLGTKFQMPGRLTQELNHHHTNPAMLKVGHSHIDAGVSACEWGPAYSGNAY